jgi:hypothetical protein
MITITQEDFQEHIDSDDGFCLECNAFTRFGDTEPDAENYPCDECGHDSCLGAEQALIEGLIEFGGEE